MKKALEILKKIWSNEIVKTTVVLVLITSISSFALGGAYNLTEDRIEVNRQKAVHDAMEIVLPEMTRFAHLYEADSDGVSVYLATSARTHKTAYAVEVKPMGYGGVIDMIVGISDDGRVTGVSIVSMTETPGLGTKILDSGYLGQFTGKTTGVSIGKGDNGVDSIAGVTVSARAVTNGVAQALEAVAAYMEVR